MQDGQSTEGWSSWSAEGDLGPCPTGTCWDIQAPAPLGHPRRSGLLPHWDTPKDSGPCRTEPRQEIQAPAALGHAKGSRLLPHWDMLGDPGPCPTGTHCEILTPDPWGCTSRSGALTHSEIWAPIHRDEPPAPWAHHWELGIRQRWIRTVVVPANSLWKLSPRGAGWGWLPLMLPWNWISKSPSSERPQLS